MNLPPWQADSHFRRHHSRKLISHNAYQMTMTPRRCQSCHGPRRPRLLQPSERLNSRVGVGRPRAASLSFTPGGQWWNELAQLQSVRHRRPPRASLALCAVIFAVTAAVVSWVLLRPLHAQRAGRRLSCADHHATCHFAGCRRAETAHRSATDQTPDSDRVTRSCTAASPRSRGSAAEYSAVLDTPGPCHGDCGNFTTILIFPWYSTRETVSFKSYRCVSCRSGAISMR